MLLDPIRIIPFLFLLLPIFTKAEEAVKNKAEEAATAKNKTTKVRETVDTVEEWPSYDRLYTLEKDVVEAISGAWRIAKEELTEETRKNRTFIEDDLWQRIMVKFFEAQAVKVIDLDIRFRRNPGNFLDVLLGFTTLEQMKEKSRNPKDDKYSFVKLRWIELSSLASQFLRFYDWKFRDIFSGGPGMLEIMEAYSKKKAFYWESKEGTDGSFVLIEQKKIPSTVVDKLMLDDGNKDVFLGLRKLIDMDPDVLTKSKFDATACEKEKDHLHIEPSGLDIPYYLLFFLANVDMKNYVLTNIVNIYKTVFFNEVFENQAELRTELSTRVKQKIELFDAAFGQILKFDGPIYYSYPGLTMCTPENNTLGTSYEKFTNFVKVFIAPEVDLHKSGTCRPTCDILDVTYKPCDHNDTDCRMDREKECVQTVGRCKKFDPPCPPGHYHCHNSTEKVTYCPSKRPDRLYEYSLGEDDDSTYKFGRSNQSCEEETVELKGGWKLEDDTLVNTPHFCEICTCFCFEPLEKKLGNFSIRNFVSRPVTSDFKNNRIIVGMKFHRIEDQILIAIADAVALPGKNVDHSTVRWIYPEYEKDPQYIIRLNMDVRQLNIDDVITDQLDRVVTGVRMYKSEYHGKFLYQYVGLETMTHIISKDNGTLVYGTGRYRRNANSTVSRHLYKYPNPPDGPDDPALVTGHSLPDTMSNEYVVFRATSLDKDVAQSTIPYFDSQKLISPNPRWLKGIGIIQKTCPGYGGFLAFKLIEHLFG